MQGNEPWNNSMTIYKPIATVHSLKPSLSGTWERHFPPDPIPSHSFQVAVDGWLGADGKCPWALGHQESSGAESSSTFAPAPLILHLFQIWVLCSPEPNLGPGFHSQGPRPNCDFCYIQGYLQFEKRFLRTRNTLKLKGMSLIWWDY